MASATTKPDDVEVPVDPVTSSEHSPLVLLEMIHRLKIRDVMTGDVIRLPRTAPMRRAQQLMRANNISGVPIAEERRLYGIISIDDIIRALEGGYIDDPCRRHMSTKLIVLEDAMPVSFALRYFGRYKYGRFPVLNRARALVGIISQRDINRALLVELAREVNRLEKSHVSRYAEGIEGDHLYMLREYPVLKLDFEKAGRAANEIKLLLRERGVSPTCARRVAVAAYELEINMCVHSEGGTLTFMVSHGHAEVVARDRGPGIEDVEWACRDGTSTANEWIRSLGFGAGMGLSNTRRVADTFEIYSTPGKGTVVKAGIDLEREEVAK